MEPDRVERRVLENERPDVRCGEMAALDADSAQGRPVGELTLRWILEHGEAAAGSCNVLKGVLHSVLRWEGPCVGVDTGEGVVGRFEVP